MFSFFFFNDTATTEIYTLSLHDALPIYVHVGRSEPPLEFRFRGEASDADVVISSGDSCAELIRSVPSKDRKSTRLNSSHLVISYAVFCLKNKNADGWA